MSDPDSVASPRRKRRRRASTESAKGPQAPRLSGIPGGRYQPLNPADLPVIDQAVRRILQDVGMAEAPDIVIERVTAAGGTLGQDGRLRFSGDLIERALQGMVKDFTLCGQKPEAVAMDAGLLRAFFTVFMFIAFTGIVLWAYSSRRKTDFDEAANLPLEDDNIIGTGDAAESKIPQGAKNK